MALVGTGQSQRPHGPSGKWLLWASPTRSLPRAFLRSGAVAHASRSPAQARCACFARFACSTLSMQIQDTLSLHLHTRDTCLRFLVTADFAGATSHKTTICTSCSRGTPLRPYFLLSIRMTLASSGSQASSKCEKCLQGCATATPFVVVVTDTCKDCAANQININALTYEKYISATNGKLPVTWQQVGGLAESPVCLLCHGGTLPAVACHFGPCAGVCCAPCFVSRRFVFENPADQDCHLALVTLQ